MRLTRVLNFAVASAAMAAVVGCAGEGPKLDIRSEDPAESIPAIKKAARVNDASAIPQLVKDLDSDDPAIRFYAIGALQRITGEDFGYKYFEDDAARKPAREKWQKWLESHPVTPAGKSG